jgi:hypothetical protein
MGAKGAARTPKVGPLLKKKSKKKMVTFLVFHYGPNREHCVGLFLPIYTVTTSVEPMGRSCGKVSER